MRGQIPVLFVLETKLRKYGEESKAYLHDNTFSAHPEEKEFLLGSSSWKVQKIEKEEIDFRAGPLEVTAIYLKSDILVE